MLCRFVDLSGLMMFSLSGMFTSCYLLSVTGSLSTSFRLTFPPVRVLNEGTVSVQVPLRCKLTTDSATLNPGMPDHSGFVSETEIRHQD